MKGQIIALLAAVVIIILGASAVPVSKQVQPTKTPAKKAAFLDYAWYTDEDLTFFTGITSPSSTEIMRLRSLYPLNTFTTNWAMSLHGYEWGYYIDEEVQIIYSNM